MEFAAYCTLRKFIVQDRNRDGAQGRKGIKTKEKKSFIEIVKRGGSKKRRKRKYF